MGVWNEVYGGDSEGFGVNPSSNEFRLCNSDEWRFINGGGPLEIRGYGGSGDMVDQMGGSDLLEPLEYFPMRMTNLILHRRMGNQLRKEMKADLHCAFL
ncbi:hypothetical protein Tco_0701252 [Tanacetum coccineum]